MLPLLLLTVTALVLAVLRLLAYRAQMLDMARMLEETPAESNLLLTIQMPGAAPRRLCRAVNARLEAGRQLRLETQKREQELKYTMVCISHDIRTPLAGALGYLQLLEGEPERQEEYLCVVKSGWANWRSCWRSCFSTPVCGAAYFRWSVGKRRRFRRYGTLSRNFTPSWMPRVSARTYSLTGRICGSGAIRRRWDGYTGT